MANIESLTFLMKGLYGAEVLPDEEARKWISDDEVFYIGYCFPDDRKAFYLLSESDGRLLTEEQRKVCEGLRKYPFDNAVAIVYKDDHGKLRFRVSNGIASALGNVFNAWKEWDKEGYRYFLPDQSDPAGVIRTESGTSGNDV